MEKLTFGLSVTLIGMLVVFAGLVILIFCIKAISGLAKGEKTSKKAPTQKEKVIVKTEPVSAAVQPGASSALSAPSCSPEVLAAITAAIAAVWQGPTGFVVRHVKRVSNAPAWNRAGREEQIYSRL